MSDLKQLSDEELIRLISPSSDVFKELANRNIIRSKNRFSKWFKPTEVENLELIKQYYGYSNEKAKAVLSLFGNEEIDELKQRMYKGGRTKSN